MEAYIDMLITTTVADNTVESLLEILYKINIAYNDELDQLFETAAFNAGNVLLLHNGQPDTAAMQRVSAAGFRVYCGEYDTFGWVTGCIETEKGVVVFA